MNFQLYKLFRLNSLGSLQFFHEYCSVLYNYVMMVIFSKYQGAGNDFIVIDNRKQHFTQKFKL
jgi:hypothetical protein